MEATVLDAGSQDAALSGGDRTPAAEQRLRAHWTE